MKKASFKFFSRRICARPWKLPLPSPFLVTAITGGLLITFGAGTLLARWTGTVPGMILSSLGAVLFIVCGSALVPPCGKTVSKLGFRRLKKEDWHLILTAFLLITAGAVFITAFWGEVLELFHIPYTKEQGLVQLVKEGDTMTAVQLLILTAAAVPLAEELMFRRCLYELLLPLGSAAALIGTAVIFAAAHGFLLGFPGLIFIGVIFQILANVTRNLWSSILCHAFHNALVILLAYLAA